MIQESATPRIKVVEGENILRINSRRLCLSRLFCEANKAALQREVYQRDWNIEYKGCLIGAIRLATPK